MCGVRWYVVIAALAAGLGSHVAACPPTRSHVIPAKQVTLAPAVLIQPVLVPTYSISYQPNDPLLSEIQALRREIQQLRAEKPAAPGLAAEQILVARCASCHQETVAAQKGFGLVLVEGSETVAPLSIEQKKRIVREVSRGSMPPKQPLGAAEKQALLDWLAQ